jgi:mannosyltransferase OCH1-like enzyme
MKIFDKQISKEIVGFSDIKQMAQLIKNNSTQDFLEFTKSLENKYDISSITPVIKAIYYSLIGNEQYKFQITEMYNKLPQYKLYNPNSEKCYHDYDNILEKEQINPLLKQIKDNNKVDICKVQPNNITNSIPHIFHNIWTTSSDNSNDTIVASFNKNNVYQQSNFNKIPSWQHNMWLVAEEITPQSILDSIEQSNFTVKYTTNSLFSPESNYLVNAGNSFAEMKLYTLASNLIRFGILLDQGGVYTDGDYKLNTDITPLADNFKLVVGYIASTLGTGFIASNENNPFIKQIVDLNIRNINNIESPDYVRYPCRTIDKITSSSDLTISLVFYGNYHSYNKNEELFLPPNTIYKQEGINPYLKCPREFLAKIKIIGQDDYQHSWINTTKELLGYNYSLADDFIGE